MGREFIYLPSFKKEWQRLGLKTDDYIKLENHLLENPQVAPVIQGTGGLRKLRWAVKGKVKGKGKRGGSRVIYIDFVAFEKIYLIAVYPKNRKETLTSDEKRILRSLVLELENENRK